jgi:very-short-patch-repair endonuclease
MKKHTAYTTSPLLLKRLQKNMAQLILWEYLRIKPFGYKFRRQYPVGITIADFFCREKNLAIEIDDSDYSKDRIMRGMQIICFASNEVIQNPEEVIEKIERLLVSKLLALHKPPVPLKGKLRSIIPY